MNITEIKKDLFEMPSEYQLAHCISSDAAMGAGIAVLFKKKFKLASLKTMELEVGSCHWVDRVLNLITKEKYWHKPTYDSITRSIEAMKRLCIENNINKIAMPEIGCGLDKLKWEKVKEILLHTFEDTEIEIVVCRI